MKINKFLSFLSLTIVSFPFTLLLLPVTTVVQTDEGLGKIVLNSSASSSITDQPISNPELYIKERSFSIMANGIGGTGWLLKHLPYGSKTQANHIVDNNYTYYMLTNLHVQMGMIAYGPSIDVNNVKYIWNAQDDLSTVSNPYTPLDDLYAGDTFDLNTYGWPGTFANFEFEGSGIYVQNSSGYFGVDISVARVSFGSSPSDTFLLSNLTGLNDFASHNEGFVTPIYPNGEDLTTDTDIFYGGYPYNNWYKTAKHDDPKAKNYICISGTNNARSVWYYNEGKITSPRIFNSTVGPNQFMLTPFDTYHIPTYTEGSPIVPINDAKTDKPIYSMGNYACISESAADNGWKDYKFGGGASGSLVIDQYGQAIGLYWGGLEPPTGEYTPALCVELINYDNRIPNESYHAFDDFIHEKWKNPAFSKMGLIIWIVVSLTIVLIVLIIIVVLTRNSKRKKMLSKIDISL